MDTRLPRPRHSTADSTSSYATPSSPCRHCKPNFDYLCLDGRAYTRWKEHIQPCAEKLMGVLHETRTSCGLCLVCDKEVSTSLATHIMGKAHLECLHRKLNRREPTTPRQLQEFTQVWDLKLGYGAQQRHYFFNHITGLHGFGFGPAVESPSEDVGAGSSRAFRPSASASSPPVGLSHSRALQNLSSQMPATGDYSTGRPHDVPTYDSHRPVEYEKALENKTLWRVFMDVPAKKLEDVLFNAAGDRVFSCDACGESMPNGAHEHMVSKDHFWQLWRLFEGGGLPGPHIALGLEDQPWVSRFGTSAGYYLFNMLTGEQSFENELRTANGAHTGR